MYQLIPAEIWISESLSKEWQRAELRDGGLELPGSLFYTVSLQNPHADHLPFSFSVFPPAFHLSLQSDQLSMSFITLVFLCIEFTYNCIWLIFSIHRNLKKWKCLNELQYTVALHKHALCFSWKVLEYLPLVCFIYPSVNHN